MKVAVIGAGIFGCTAAIHLARAGHEAHLYEVLDEPLKAASGVNQFRLHAGYHYPRSPETVRECQSGLSSFREEYGEAVIDDGIHLYAIAKEGSRVTVDEYLEFCQKEGLPFDVCPPVSPLRPEALGIAIRVPEGRINPYRLKTVLAAKLREAGVVLHFGEPASRSFRGEFDRIVIAAYAATNAVARVLGCTQRAYQFEVCEKPVVELPRIFRGVGVVVMDGPFCSIDPLGKTGLHVMGHVEHAIRARNIGLEPDVPRSIACRMNDGITSPRATSDRQQRRISADSSRFEIMARAASQFMSLSPIQHRGSMFTVRAVLPGCDDTDKRPTLVEELDDQVIRVFSGKIGTAVEAAKQVVEKVGACWLLPVKGLWHEETLAPDRRKRDRKGHVHGCF